MQTLQNEKLSCANEEDNGYDCFAIRTYIGSTGQTVGHLPMEISRLTYFLLKTMCNCVCNPFIHQLSDIAFVSRWIRNSMQSYNFNGWNHQKQTNHRNVLDVLYKEPGSTAVLGTFLKHHDTINATKTLVKIKAKEKEPYLQIQMIWWKAVKKLASPTDYARFFF